MKKYYIYLLILIVSINIGFSQTPINDKNWIIHFEDNFDNPTLDINKWDYKKPWGTCAEEATLTDPNNGGNNHIFSNGKLKLVSREATSECNKVRWEQMLDALGNPLYDSYGNPLYEEFEDFYTMLKTTGNIISKQAFKYGYIETLIKIPEATNTQIRTGFVPAFFMWPLSSELFVPVLWSEIDIFEIPADSNRYTFCVHYEDTIINNHNENSAAWTLTEQEIIRPSPNDVNPYWQNIDFSIPHKFGCEWTPKYISFYLDDKLIYTTNATYLYNGVHYQYTDDLLPMNLWLGIATPGGSLEFASNTLFPYEMEIDYVRVYKLKMDCTNDFYSNYGYSNFDNKVKRNIVLEHQIPIGRQEYSFRATQVITLDDGFEVPIGRSVYLNNSDCEY